jgi:hypothetical protein
MYNHMKTIIYYLHRGDKIPFYVGKTRNLKNRLNTHKFVFGKNIFIEFLDEIEDWKYWEKYYISLFKKLGHILENKNNGGGGPSEGVIFPEERKHKISQSNKGTIHPIEGRISTSNKLKGRKLPPEQIEKIRLAKTGKPNTKKGKSDGPKPGVSEAHKGRTSPNKGKGTPVTLYTISGEYLNTYPNYTTLALNLNINPETVRCHLVGKANTICNKQYKVKYVLGDD